MTPDELIAAFDVVAEAPDGVARLRELVLQLAVRGKLVAQDPEDEPASVLRERIVAEKTRLIEAGTILNHPPLPRPAEADVPFLIPVGWAPVRLADLGGFVGGKTPSKSKASYWTGGIPWVSPKDMKTDFIVSSQDEVSAEALEDGLALVPAGSILIVVRSGILKHTVPVAVNAVACTINQDLKALVLCPSALASYLRIMVQGFESYILEHLTKTGTTVESVKFSEFAEQPFLLPPLAEQHRIVARVDELMGLLDRLEAARTTRERTRVAVRDSALDALREAATVDEVEIAWKRFASRVEAVLYDVADFAPLRRALIDLAVHGRLVAQDPADEAASLQLARILSERARPARVGGSAAVAPPPLPSKTETPFELPNGWTWCRFGDLLVDGPTNGWSPTTVAHDTGVRTLKLSATTSGLFDGRHSKFVEAKLQPDSPLWLEPGDLLIQRSNTPEYVGMAAVYRGPPYAFIYPDLMMRCRLSSATSIEFVHAALLSPASRAWFSERASGTSQSMVKLNQGTVRATLLPLPPIAEQHRIVSRLAELMGLADRLQARVAATDTAHQAFATAAVHDLVT